MNTKNIIWSVVGGIVGALLIMLVVHVTTSPKSFGSLANCSNGYTCYTYLDVLNNLVVDGATTLTSFQLGTSGTVQTNQVITTCSLIANNSAATNTPGYAYCTGVTGVTSADFITASFATSSTLITDGFIIQGAKASSTAGAIDFVIENQTGAAGAPSARSTIGSTTVIRAGH